MQLTAFIVSLLWSVFSFSVALWEEEKVIRQKGQKNGGVCQEQVMCTKLLKWLWKSKLLETCLRLKVPFTVLFLASPFCEYFPFFLMVSCLVVGNIGVLSPLEAVWFKRSHPFNPPPQKMIWRSLIFFFPHTEDNCTHSLSALFCVG